jgi:hypothetical protein
MLMCRPESVWAALAPGDRHGRRSGRAAARATFVTVTSDVRTVRWEWSGISWPALGRHPPVSFPGVRGKKETEERARFYIQAATNEFFRSSGRLKRMRQC